MSTGIIDTDDCSDRKPVSLTKSDTQNTEGEVSFMNSFDAVVYLALVVAVVLGFNSGLLRSAVTILAYLVAMPIAIWATSFVAPAIGAEGDAQLSQNWPLLFGIFLAAGIVLGKLMRMVLDETIGPGAGTFDRLAGAGLGARRPGRGHAGHDLRSAGAAGPPAFVPRGFTTAAAVVGGRPNRFSLAAAGGRGHDRSAEAGPVHIKSRI